MWELLFLLAIHLPFAFIYPLDQIGKGSGVESRFALFSAPFLHLWVGEPVAVCGRRVWKAIAMRSCR